MFLQASSSSLQILITTTIGFLALLTMHYRHHKHPARDKKTLPKLQLTKSGRAEGFERFSHYVARQIGFADPNECSIMCKIADNYLRQSKDSDDNLFAYFENDPNGEALYIKLVQEFDKCVLGYFAFHWSQTTLMISQVLSIDSETKKRLKNIVMAATRKQRFDRVTKNLKVTRVFSTLVEELKAIRIPSSVEDWKCTDVMVPMAHNKRSPILLFMGGGMGAGKSTVLKDILKDAFWSEAAANAVVVEADAFKETDVIYRALSSRGHHHDMLQTAELVHQSSTDAASSLLVTALNEGRDVIMDGTLSWEPFVYQTIAMARNVHHHRYRMGVGYKVEKDGSVIENYWEQIEEEQQEDKSRKPYRIELVGVVCDAYLAVVRGIRRAIHMGRAVRVKSQLTSHKRFAKAFPKYCPLVDNARLFCSTVMGAPPKLIGWKEGDGNFLVDPIEIYCLTAISSLNENAESIYELYEGQDPATDKGSVWNDVVLSPSRPRLQEELKNAIQRIETPLIAEE